MAHRTVYCLSVFLGLMVAAPTAQAQGASTFRCALPSLTGGPPQNFIMDVVPPFIRRREGSTYKIIADDGDTLVAGAFDWAPEVALLVLVRSSGLLKFTALTNSAAQDPAYIATCTR